MSDFELCQAVSEGDNSAFEELLDRYKNLVYSVVLRMVNCPQDADDQAQEIFIKIYKNAGKYSDEFKFSTWAMRIATNHIIDFRRKNKLAQVTDGLDTEVVANIKDDAKGPEEAAIAKEQTTNLHNAMQALPDMYRLPIVMYHLQGLSYQEIAECVNEPMSKVKNRMARARKMLKEELLKMQRGGAAHGM